MGSIETHGETTSKTSSPAGVDMKLEVAVIPVANVDRAKDFYVTLGWRLDADFARVDGSRAVQLTPPGSPASIQFGAGPGLLLYLVVSDIEAARAELVARGVDVSEVFHRSAEGRVGGPDPERRSYGSLATFTDPDGTIWLVQEVTRRAPGRVDAGGTFASAHDLAGALRRAAAAHGEHEKRIGHRDDNWPDWYAEHIFGEQTGKEPPS